MSPVEGGLCGAGAGGLGTTLGWLGGYVMILWRFVDRETPLPV